MTAEYARRLLKGDLAAIYLYDPSTTLLHPLTDGAPTVAEPPVPVGGGLVGLAFETGAPVVVNDLAAWSLQPPDQAAQAMGSGVSVPLLGQDGPVGAIAVWTSEARKFSPEDVNLLVIYAGEVAPRVLAARLAMEAEVKARIFHAIGQIADAASGNLQPSQLAALVVDQVMQLLNTDGAALLWWDPQERRLVSLASAGRGSDQQPAIRGPEEGATGVAFREKRTVVIDDYQAWEGGHVLAVEHGVASSVAVPLVIQDRATGVIALWTYEKRRLSAEELQVLTLFASQVAPAIESANVLQERQKRADVLGILYELAVAASSAGDPTALARRAVDCARDLVGARSALIYLWDPDEKCLRRPVHNDPEWAFEARALRGALASAAARREPVVVDDYESWEGAHPKAVKMGIRSLAALPLVQGEQLIGALGVIGQGRLHADDIQSLSLLAGLIAPSLRASQLLKDRERQAHRFRVLHEVAVAASGVVDPVSLATLTVDHARDLLGAEGAALVWAEPDGLRVLADNSGAPMPAVIGTEHGAVGAAMKSRQPVVISDYAKWPHAHEPALKAGIKSVAAVPLLVGELTVGGLVLRSKQRNYFDADKLLMITLLAAQVAPGLRAAGLAQERETQREALQALHELAVAASGVLEPAALAANAIKHILSLFQMDRAAIWWWNEELGHLVSVAESETNSESRDLLPGEGLAGSAFAALEPIVVEDYQDWPQAPDWALKRGWRSGIGVPLLVKDRAAGALAILFHQPRRFEPYHIQLLTLLAAQVAPALHSARLHANLATSEERFRSLYGTMACGVLVQAATGEVVDANPAAERILGLSVQEMRGRRSDLLWKTRREDGRSMTFRSRPAMLSAKRQRPVRSVTLRIGRVDGQERWLQVDSIPMPGSGGAPGQVVSSFVDITQLKRAEAALRESESRFRAVFDRSAVGIARLSLKGVVMDANPALLAMLGAEPEEMVGKQISDFVHPPDYRPEPVELLLAGELAELQSEIRLARRDGGLIWGRSSLTLVRDAAGVPLFMIALLENITERKAQEAALEHQALHDSLTDLPNRVLLHDRLQQAIKQCHREHLPMALLVLDLDRFKAVNDTFGHHGGDVLLREVAARLRAQLRASDTVARMSGDEFALVLPDVDGELGAAQAARKLLKSLEPRFILEGREVEIGASIGIALFPNNGETSDSLLRRADVAMYVAKRAVSGYAFYTSEHEVASPGRLELMTDLRPAIDQGQLLLHYQPKFDLRTGEVAGVEALVRWQHPGHGLLLPENFITLAEQTGLIRSLGIWVLENTLEQASIWREQGLEVPVAVNLSMRNLHDPQLPETIEALLQQHRVPSGMLQVEITESTLMVDPEYAMRVLTSLDGMGVRLSIDDFGIGYSSLAYLRRLPAEEIKIDRSFVSAMTELESDAVIVRSTIDLGHNLGLRVVAEGVETQAAWDLLASIGCDLAQGFLMGLPAPAEELNLESRR
jgi:diguanylate cyclase (GGDEF)-like protein/PAS domain S-box-containing protein